MTQHSSRSDSSQEKLQQLKAAYDAGRHDLVLSLAASLRDSIGLEQQLSKQERQFPSLQSTSVRQLPVQWARWARGWDFYRAITIFDSIGVQRAAELIEVAMAFPIEQISDVYREIRVARVESDGSLREIPSQIYDDSRGAKQITCRICFFADVPTHGSATVLIFHGNANAQLPDYKSDLSIFTSGSGYGIQIDNLYYRAVLSQQMGQLERLTIKREHGLELYAGGKGHGEPPTIDWAHDYVDEAGFQKLRIRNWPQCPNYELERGPLFVRLRRWGFPYSPVHPVFVPSRMHVDQTYTFFAGLPFFFKQGRMEAVKEVAIDAMRDDEWVLSGYSFTDLLWIDEQGRVQLGSPPPEYADRLWGVGFFHRESRDAFVALWLKHEVEGFDRISHSGSPTLQYAGHGQLWSRYPAQRTTLPAGATFHQHNAYVVWPIGDDADRQRVERLRHQLMNPLEISFDTQIGSAGETTGALARFGETQDTATRKAEIWNALRAVKDEQLYTIDSNIVDFGYVYDVRVRDATATIVVTMPHRGRPVYDFLVWQGGGRVTEGIREVVLKVPGVRQVLVEFTWYPAWSIARLSPAARESLGMNA